MTENEVFFNGTLNEENEDITPVFSGEVLLCEDNAVNRRLISSVLTEYGLRVTLAEDGLAGLNSAREKMAQGEPFLIIFMDMSMPVMDGLEAALRLKECGSITPVVALTATPLQGGIEAYSAKGISDYLPKPFTNSELLSCLKRHLTPDSEKELERAYPLGAGLLKNSADAFLKGAAGSFIDKELGISLSGGSAVLYGRLLADFSRDNANFMFKLNAALASNEIKQARRMAHTLKGLSGLIGAKKLKNAAGAVELELAMAIGVGSMDSSVVPARLMNELEASLNEVLSETEPLAKEIRKKEELAEELEGLALNAQEQGTAGESKPQSAHFDRDRAMAVMKKLEPMVSTGDVDCLSCLSEVKAVCGAKMPVETKRLIELIEEYEFELALSAIRDIKKAL